MKRSTFIIIGIFIIVLLLAFWVYSLIYGTPQKGSDVFANFGLFGNSSTTVSEVPITNDPAPEPMVDVTTPAKLRQLTVRPVIGFREFQATTTEPKFITYAEAGTGYIYTINLTTGEETRISNITIPVAEKAEFSPNGKFVAIRSGYSKKNEVVLVNLSDLSNIKSDVLPSEMNDFIFSPNDELEFTVVTTSGTVGRIMNPQTRAVRDVFNIPFQSAAIIWSPENNIPNYVYPKASSRLNGFLYEIKGGTIVRMPVDGLGLTAEASADYVIFNRLVDLKQESFFYNTKTGEINNSPTILLPDKCVFASRDGSKLYCGYEITDYTYTFPDDWYKGTRVFSDRIWEVDLNRQSATQVISPPIAVGRELDITNMSIGLDDTMLYFINKNDNTLWTYEI